MWIIRWKHFGSKYRTHNSWGWGASKPVVTLWNWNVWHSNILSTKNKKQKPTFWDLRQSSQLLEILLINCGPELNIFNCIISILFLYLQQNGFQQEIRCSVSLSLFSFLSKLPTGNTPSNSGRFSILSILWFESCLN